MSAGEFGEGQVRLISHLCNTNRLRSLGVIPVYIDRTENSASDFLPGMISRLLQVTWRNQKVFIYDQKTLLPVSMLWDLFGGNGQVVVPCGQYRAKSAFLGRFVSDTSPRLVVKDYG